jgi:UDP-glucose 4-epimerase
MIQLHSLPRSLTFSSQASSSKSLSEPNSPLIESCLLSSGVSTPATETSILFDQLGNPSPPNEFSEDSFILVIGGLGYIGSHTSWDLLRAGHNVIIIDNLYNSNRNVLSKLEDLINSHYKPLGSRPRLDFYEVDYRDQQHVRTILDKYQSWSSTPSLPQSNIAGVIHFAAYKAVAESFRKPLDYYANNVGGMIDFCTTLSEFNIKTFIFSSSATVYGALANSGGRLLEEQCNSTGCAGLINPYGRTKWMCEAILSDLALSDPEWTIIALRYFNPIGCDPSGTLGEDPRDAPTNLMPIVIKAMTGEYDALNIFGTDWDTPDGTAVRDFIHVSDLAAGHLAALKSTQDPTSGTGYQTFNLGTGTGYSVKDIVSTMEQASGRIIPTTVSPRREGDVGICIAEPSKSAMLLGWKAEKTLRQACDDLCRYLKLGRESRFPAAKN